MGGMHVDQPEKSRRGLRQKLELSSFGWVRHTLIKGAKKDISYIPWSCLNIDWISILHRL